MYIKQVTTTMVRYIEFGYIHENYFDQHLSRCFSFTNIYTDLCMYIYVYLYIYTYTDIDRFNV